VDHQIAYALIDGRLKELRQRSYGDLVTLIGHPQTKQIRGEDGKEYQLEVQVFWDSKKGGRLRVMVAADDGGWRAFKPLTDDFIMAPDGSFVGEPFSGPIPKSSDG
jgi:hypothetical protein